MKMLRSLKNSLQTRCIIAMAVMLLPLVAFLVVGRFFLFPRLTGAFDAVVKIIEEKHIIVNLQNLILKAAMPPNDYLIHGDPAERELFIQLSQEVDEAFEDAFASPFEFEEDRAMVDSAFQEWQRALSMGKALLAFPDPVGNPTAALQMEHFDLHIDQVVERLNNVHKLEHGEVEEKIARVDATKRRVLGLFQGMFAVGFGIAVAAGLALAHSILNPVSVLKEGASRFGAGILSHRIPTNGDELGQLAMTFNTMAEQLQNSQETLKDLASHDGLTGLYNHREFYRLLEEEVKRSLRYHHSFSLLIVDLDHFKAVNDTYGHQVGDEVLCAIATLILGKVRSTDRVARYGGEEFVIILTETPGSDAQVIAERIRISVSSHPIAVTQEEKVNLTVSIGLSAFPEDGGSGKEIIHAADQALYAAKNAGRNKVCRVAKS